MHARGLAGGLGRASERTPNSGGEFFAGLCFGFSFHCDLSNNFGVLPELSLDQGDGVIRWLKWDPLELYA